jgi:hypothetical protein
MHRPKIDALLDEPEGYGGAIFAPTKTRNIYQFLLLSGSQNYRAMSDQKPRHV